MLNTPFFPFLCFQTDIGFCLLFLFFFFLCSTAGAIKIFMGGRGDDLFEF